ncbi:MAG: hypothetical protein LAP61_22950 [Acidobacteriia bacterium]|nr:hypothetical protein [Terriglobia bacterium]
MSGSIKKGRKPSKRSAGRPKAEISLKQLERLCELQPTHEELATYFQVSARTIERFLQTPEGKQAAEWGYGRGRISLRRQQFKLLREGSNTMAIWLGKQILGQRDKVEQTLRTPPGDPLRIEAEVSDRRQAILLNQLFAPEEIAAAHQKMLERERVAQAAAMDHGQTTQVH